VQELTFPVRYSPNTSVILCVQIPPPSIASTDLDPVEIIMTFCRRSASSRPVAKAVG
jgi:hypothetical protein